MDIKNYAAPALFFLLFFAVVMNIAAQNIGFDYLEVKNSSVKTTHQAKYKIRIDKSFKLLGEFDHQPTYGDKQFNVSMAAFSAAENIIMIHAETHTDGSGGLDYSKLAPDALNGLKFTSREQCAAAEDEAELAANPQIKFLRDKGFSLTLPFYLKQYFTTSADGKAEVVISYGRHISSCDESAVKSDFKKQIEQEVRQMIKIEKN